MFAERLWDRGNRRAVLLTSGALILAIALVDYWTLPYVSLGYFYLFPIILAAGFLPRGALVAIGLVCAVLSEAFSSLDAAGRPVRFAFEALALIGCGLFFSELIRNRRLARDSHRRLYTLVETSPAAILTIDPHGSIEMANQAAHKLFRPEDGKLTAQSIACFVPDLLNALQTGITQIRTSIQCPARRADGETFDADIWFSTFQEGGLPKLAAIIADVTDERPRVPEPVTDEAEPKGQPVFNSRQVAVLRLVFEGLPNHEIARKLQITGSAVKNTLQQIFAKAGVRNRSQMVRVTLERYRNLL
jgi:PAS domain S-box-containing protein